MKQHIALIVMLVALLAGCERAPVKTDPDAYRLRGTLSGRAGLYNYQTFATLHGGITVSVDGTNYKAVTDSTGLWTIRDLPAGIYTLRYSKEGYSTITFSNQQFVGGGELEIYGTFYVARCPVEYSISNFQVNIMNPQGVDKYLTFTGDISDTIPAGVNARVFITKDTSIDVATVTSYYDIPKDYYVDLLINKGVKTFSDISGPGSTSHLSYFSSRFRSGDTVYAFAHTVNATSLYWNTSTIPPFMKVARTAINPVRSNVVKFVLP